MKTTLIRASSLLALLVALPAGAAKLAVFAPPAGPGVSAKEALALTDAVAGAASRAGHDVVTEQQLAALVGLEQAKQMAGCDAGACAAEIGAALGVDAVVNVSYGKVGQSIVVAVKRTDVKGGSGRVADKRIKGMHALDAALDALPGLTTEALTGVAPTTSTTTPSTTTPTTPTTPSTTAPTTPATSTAPTAALPTLRAKTPVTPPKKLAWFKDSAGRYLAFDPDHGYDGVLFWGTAAAMHEVRPGAGASGDGEGGFSRMIWDPRFDTAARSIDKKGKVVSVTCGDKTTTLTSTSAPAGAKFFGPMWLRQGLFVARDDQLRYLVVDAARDDKDGKVKDRRVYLGKKGKLVPLALELDDDASFGDGGLIGVAAGVTLKVGPGGGSLAEGGVTTLFTGLDLYQAARPLYTEILPWGEGPLGTPCDP
jgi:hypothetical protein